MIDKIVSGGQTGVDRAALDTAINNNIAYCGWCPRGRLAEDGAIDEQYDLKETKSNNYAQRTEWNVRDSDGTLILNTGPLQGGTALTANLATLQNKPFLIVNLDVQPDTTVIVEWITSNDIKILNIAGPRERKQPGIYKKTCQLLEKLIMQGE